MAEKRYFWLKLKEDFFDDKQIKYLRSLPDGDKVVITYLKMQLKSLKTAGTIRYDRILPSTDEELSLMLDEDINIVKFTLSALQKINAIEILEDESIYMLAIQELIGNEGASARRMRIARSNQKALASHCDTNVQKCDSDVQNRYGEIEVDIDKEIDIEKELDADADVDKNISTILQICKNRGIEISSNAEMYIKDCLCNHMTPQMIIYAISDAVDHQIKNWSYIQSILNRYKFEGYTTIADIKQDTAERTQANEPRYNKKFLNQF